MPTSDWAPTLQDVGARIRARTRDDNGNELGTWTADTRPTAAEVQRLIDSEVEDLASLIACNVELADDYWTRARALAAIGTAMAVELGFFPEQVASGRSPYEQLHTLRNEALKRLQTAIAACGGTNSDGSGSALGPAVIPGTGLNTTPPDFEIQEGALGWGSQW